MTRPLVLVADDNSAVVELTRATLETIGAQVVTAADGEEAVRLAREHRPDLIVLDLLMPKLDGLSVLARLRGDPATKSVPVLVMTGLEGTEGARLARLYGAAGLLEKPFRAEDLAQRCKALLAAATVA